MNNSKSLILSLSLLANIGTYAMQQQLQPQSNPNYPSFGSQSSRQQSSIRSLRSTSQTQPLEQDLVSSQNLTIVYDKEPDTRFIRILNWFIKKFETKRDNAIQNELEKTRKKEQDKLVQENEKEVAQLVNHSKLAPIVSIAMLAGNLGFAWYGKNKCQKEKTFYPGAVIGSALCLWSLCRNYHNNKALKEYAKLKAIHKLESPLQPSPAAIATLEHVQKMLEKNKKSNSWVKNGNKLGMAGSLFGLGAASLGIMQDKTHLCPQLFAVQCATNGIAMLIQSRNFAAHNEKIEKELQKVKQLLNMMKKITQSQTKNPEMTASIPMNIDNSTASAPRWNESQLYTQPHTHYKQQ